MQRSLFSCGHFGDYTTGGYPALFPHILPIVTPAPRIADRFTAGLSQIPLRYPGRRQVQSWSQTGPKLVTYLLAPAS